MNGTMTNLMLVTVFLSFLIIFGVVQFIVNNDAAERASKDRNKIIGNQEYLLAHMHNMTQQVLDILQNKSK
jgi:hypothetical protein